MQTITFPRDLYFLRAAIGNQNPQILEVRSPSSAGARVKKTRVSGMRKSSEHHRKGDGARKSYVWLHAKFAKMNMTRRLRLSLPASVTPSIASSAQFTRSRRFARTATAG